MDKPHIHVTEDNLPEIKDWEVGKTYEVVVQVKMISKSQGDMYMAMPGDMNQKKFSASLEVENMEVSEEKDVKDMTDKEFSTYSAEEKRKSAGMEM